MGRSEVRSMSTVLLVEDNDFVRLQLTRFLSDEGYKVVEASDGLTALAAMKDDIALALVDIRMQPVDGFEFVKSIRAKNLQTPVIFMTGDANDEAIAKAEQLGVSTVLTKPVPKDRLVKLASRAISAMAR